MQSPVRRGGGRPFHHQRIPKVTRQDSTLKTCAKVSLADNSSGRGLPSRVFKALFHCFQCFPAGLGHKRGFPLSKQCTLRKAGIYISKFDYKDVFFLRPVLGRQFSSVSSGGPALQPAVLGQPAAEADRTEGEQSESHS